MYPRLGKKHAQTSNALAGKMAPDGRKNGERVAERSRSVNGKNTTKAYGTRSFVIVVFAESYTTMLRNSGEWWTVPKVYHPPLNRGYPGCGSIGVLCSPFEQGRPTTFLRFLTVVMLFYCLSTRS